MIKDKSVVDSIRQKIKTAIRLKRAGNFKSANRIYEYLDKKYPNQPQVLKFWAKILVLTGEYKRAKKYFKKAEKIFQKNFFFDQARRCRGHVLRLNENDFNSSSFDIYLKGLRGNPSISISNGKPDKSFDEIFNEQECIEYFNIHDKYPLIINNVSEVISNIKIIFDKFDITEQVLNSFNYLMSLPDELKKNFQQLQKIKKLLFATKTAIFNLGLELYLANKLLQAKYFFIVSLGIDPNYHIAYEYLGDTYKKEKNYHFALKNYKKALDICESDIKVESSINKKELITNYYYSIALCHKGLGNYDRAEEYIIKCKNMQDKDFFGFIYDGFNNLNSVVKDIKVIQENFKKVNQPTEEDYEKTINEIGKSINPIEENNSKLIEEESKLNLSSYSFFEMLSEQGKLFIKTAESLYYTYPADIDYAPVMVEYCKVLEVELYEKIYKKLESWCISTNNEIRTGPNPNRDINQFNKITLGSFIHLTNEPQFLSFIEESYSNDYYDFLTNFLPEKVNKIVKFRNSSAHKNATTLNKVNLVRKILIKDNLLEKICKSFY